MTRDVHALGDDKTGAVVGDLYDDSSVTCCGRDPDTGRMRVLLNVGERLGNVLEDDRLHLCWQAVRELQVEVRFDAGVHTEGFQAVADRLLEPYAQIQGFRADSDQQPAQ